MCLRSTGTWPQTVEHHAGNDVGVGVGGQIIQSGVSIYGLIASTHQLHLFCFSNICWNVIDLFEKQGPLPKLSMIQLFLIFFIFILFGWFIICLREIKSNIKSA